MAKKIKNKYIWYLTRQIIFLVIALAAVCVSLYFLFAEYQSFFTSTDTKVFWIGYLLIAVCIIGFGISILSAALTIKAIFYIKMGYEYNRDEDQIKLKKGTTND